MPFNTTTFSDNNFGSPSTAWNAGPYTISSYVNKIVRVKCRINFGFPGANISPTATPESAVMWGVQYGTEGYSPWSLPGDESADAWFWANNTGGNGLSNAFWTPDTDAAAAITTDGGHYEWRGQLYAGVPVDFYVSYGAFISGYADFVASHVLSVTCLT